MRTVGGYFLRAARARPDGVFLRVAGGRSWTYAEAAARIERTIAWLRGMGLARGDRAVVYVDDFAESTILTLACAVSGVVPLPVSPVFSTDYVREVRDRVGARQVIGAPDRLEALAAARIDALTLPPESPPGRAGTLEALEDLAACTAVDDAFLVQPSSGSTGHPKLVLRAHVAFARYAERVGPRLAHAGDPPRVLAAAALTHAFGLHMLTTALSLGGEMAVPSAIDTHASLDEVRALDPTVLPLTPRVFRALARQAPPEAPRLFGPGARVVVTAGAPPDEALVDRARAEGLEAIELYGSSEMSLLAMTPRGAWRAGWAGQGLDDCRYRLGADRELLVRSAGAMLGYADDPGLTRSSHTEDGYFRTGDLAEIDEAGWIRILGRKRDVLNTPEGSNIYAERIELMLESLPGVRQSFLVGDQKPFLTAALVVGEDEPGHAFTAAGAEADGYLPYDRFEPLYRRTLSALAPINERLEAIERVKRVALFARAFDPAAYTVVGPGKVRRDRAEFVRRYRARVDALYDEDAAPRPPPTANERTTS